MRFRFIAGLGLAGAALLAACGGSHRGSAAPAATANVGDGRRRLLST